MKLPLIWIAVVALLSTPLFAEVREFTSSDGSRKIQAELIRYHRHDKTVTLEMPDGRRTTTSIELFSKEDQEFFEKAAFEEETRDAIKVDFRSRAGVKTVEKDDKRKIGIEKREYSHAVVVENTSDLPLQGLSIRYWLVLERHDASNKERLEVIDGKDVIATINAREKKELAGPTVVLTMGAFANCRPECNYCQKAFNNAAAVQRERVFGHKVEVLDASGKVIASDCNSKRVEEMLKK